MINLNQITDDLIEDEGTQRNANDRHIVYQDSLGIWTLGYGRNVQKRGLNEEEARYLLHNDVVSSYLECVMYIEGFERLNMVRRQVLVNMMFNLGLPRLRGFKKMLAAVAKGEPNAVAREMLDSKWADQVGRRAAVLAGRYRRGER